MAESPPLPHPTPHTPRLLTSRSRLPHLVIYHNSSRPIQVSHYPNNPATAILLNLKHPSSSTALRQVDRVLKNSDAKGIANTPATQGDLSIFTAQVYRLDCTQPSVNPPYPLFVIVYRQSVWPHDVSIHENLTGSTVSVQCTLFNISLVTPVGPEYVSAR